MPKGAFTRGEDIKFGALYICNASRGDITKNVRGLKVHKNENFFGFDFEFCTISSLVMSKY